MSNYLSLYIINFLLQNPDIINNGSFFLSDDYFSISVWAGWNNNENFKKVCLKITLLYLVLRCHIFLEIHRSFIVILFVIYESWTACTFTILRSVSLDFADIYFAILREGENPCRLVDLSHWISRDWCVREFSDVVRSTAAIMYEMASARLFRSLQKHKKRLQKLKRSRHCASSRWIQ